MGPRLLLFLITLPACASAQVARVPSSAYGPGSLPGVPLGGSAVYLRAPSSVFRAGLPLSPVASSLPSLPSLGQGAAPAPVLETAKPGGSRAAAIESLVDQAENLRGLENAPETGGAAASAAAFDGSRLEAPAPDVSPVQADAPAELPPYLAVADPEDRRWIGSALDAASRSRTGRRVLAQVSAMSKAQGRPVMVEFADLRTNNGEFVYDWGMLRMALSYKKLAPEASAPVFIHELLHAVQRFHRLPSDAVEMELEAHVVTIEVARELGLRFRKGEFSREALELLKRSPSDFTEYVAASYSDNLGYGAGQDLAEFERRLLRRRGRSKAGLRRLEGALSRRRATLQRMRESGQPEEEVRGYERDVVEPAAVKLRREAEALSRLEADLALLKDPDSRERYRNYARRVRALVGRAHLRLRRR